MARHLKSIVKNRLKGIISYYAPHSDISASHRRGVCYFVPITSIKMLYGAMNTVKEGYRYKKHIIVRSVPRSGGHVLQLYTYHFPKTWSAACVANRELIKEAQRRAHALEHDHSLAALDWRIRFFHHYYRVFKGGATPEPGFKRYSRFYQYTYVAIYRELKAAQQAAEDVSFEPVSDTFTVPRYSFGISTYRHIDISKNHPPFISSKLYLDISETAQRSRISRFSGKSSLLFA